MNKWWQEAIGYQIYLRSFYDSNGDGIGDLQGVLAKLDYLEKLGVNLLWISPFYDSPLDDYGYDIRDFCQIHKEYGTKEDFRSLIKTAHQRGMKIIIDLVMNHTSDEHPWFLESKKGPTSPYYEYYHWRKPQQDKTVPNSWTSFFGGSAWQYNEELDAYYLRIFSQKMPDLNWENPDVRAEMKAIINFWKGFDIDGFRIDAVSHLAKDEEGFYNRPRVHAYLKELKPVFSNLLTIGELGGEVSIDEALGFISSKREEIDLVFNFDHNWCFTNEQKTDIIRMKQTFGKWQNGLFSKAWNALYWLNHDHPRLMNHYGDVNY
ncbi:MAG: glucohydrolase, partial [Acholeplasmataceae bacterium]|nr:glucohydrolase [Acholeplasmataceae bacterium]